jgi:2-dehydro-3-deoxyphosphooctonate aldolase (KDO 8-P synthase)
MAPREVRIGGVSVGGEKLAVIAGPCAVESEEVVFKAAETVAAIRDKFKLPAVFKSSYMKANRLSGESFSTIGIGRALSILQDVKGKFKLPILTGYRRLPANPGLFMPPDRTGGGRREDRPAG